MKLRDVDILLVPGLGNAQPGHWQRRWQEKLPNATWVEQKNWESPAKDDWVENLAKTVMMATRPVVLVGHSLGVHAIAHLGERLVDTKVRGALLVSPPDMNENAKNQSSKTDFAPVPTAPLPFPSIMIVSDDDPYTSVETAADLANCWGSEFHTARECGHINLESGHGLWPDGMMMLGRLLQRI